MLRVAVYIRVKLNSLISYISYILTQPSDLQVTYK